jgi:hypothetical protein
VIRVARIVLTGLPRRVIQRSTNRRRQKKNH